MIQLTYTQEMQEQDKLWADAKEDLNVMERLYNEIIYEAKNKGFNGIALIYDGQQEKLCVVYENKEQQKLANLGKVDVLDCGYCKPLIKHLEKILNNREV